MRSRLSTFLLIGAALFYAFALAGCSGGNSGAEEPKVELVAQSFNEGCTLCHGAGNIVDVAQVHSLSSSSPKAEITSVDFTADPVTVNFKIYDQTASGNVPLAGVPASDIRITVAKLVTGAAAPDYWQSYINATEVKDAGEPGTAPDGNTTTQATYERASAGTFVDDGNGTYHYTFDAPIVANAAYDVNATTRIGMQIPGNAENAVVDFVPALNAAGDNFLATPAEMIVTNASCNECHIKLSAHGGDRIQTTYCVTCHNPGTTDANSGNTVDFKVMIHKIHRGENLPEVEAGGEYAIWGHSNSKLDFSTVVYPQDIRNCTKCHTGADAATPEGDNWKTAPSTAACTACHEAKTDGFPAFPNLTPAEIETAHQIPLQIAATKFKLNILDVGTSAGTAGALNVTIDFSVTDPTNANLAYDIANTSTVDLTHLSFLIGLNTRDYTNTGSGKVPAQPVSVPVTRATNTGANIFRVTAADAVPAGVTGSGVVGFQGYGLADIDGDGAIDSGHDDRVPVKSAVKSFAITDTVAQDRRVIVDIAKCDQCHANLNLHGGNRNDEPQLCVICHNPDATDIEVRPAASAAVDGKAEQPIDFKNMIHAIHAGDIDQHGFRENGVVVYGYGGSINDYSHVRLPAGIDNLKNCEGCHKSGTYTVPISSNALPTTTGTGSNLDSPDDDTNITPTSSACSSCHDSIFAKTHMTEQGGRFEFVPFKAATSSGSSDIPPGAPGPVSAQPPGHTARTDCSSCHS